MTIQFFKTTLGMGNAGNGNFGIFRETGFPDFSWLPEKWIVSVVFFWKMGFENMSSIVKYRESIFKIFSGMPGFWLAQFVILLQGHARNRFPDFF